MDKVSLLPAGQRSELFKSTALRKGMVDAVVEKDFWVCWSLARLFAHPEISRIILFKGGTSLSKVFHLIERFSEDIDLILDWSLLTNEDPKAKRSKTQQDTFNKGINESAQEYIRNKMLPEISKAVGPLCSAAISAEDPHIVNIRYPAAFGDEYIKPYIQLEIGPLASWIPHGEYSITPYAAEIFPDVFENPDCKVRAIKAERTFWEKVTILHQEAFRPEDKIQPSGYSRHYYDTAMMSRSPVKEAAIADIELMRNVVEFKKQFYPRAWANYDKAVTGTVRIVPPDYLMDTIRNDYSEMRHMIFGEYPVFDEIMETLRGLEKEINRK
ncbi:MAG: nucleotidyl transferase AbiEii/AbiGii toxin family protein [Victivallales bacterium]